MKILLVEDQPDKREHIKKYLTSKFVNNVEITDKESLRGALKAVVSNNKYDLILLDMSMPNFDPSVDDPTDSSPESFAGKELLEQMKLRGLKIPVIVITQYSSFEGGVVTLESLSEQFENKFGEFYIGSVYFNLAVDAWKNQLGSLLRKINE